MLSFIEQKKTLLASVLAIIGLLSGFLIYRGVSATFNITQSAASESVKEELANLTGEKAVNHLKKTGAYDSLTEVLSATRYKAEATESGATATNHANQIKSTFTAEGLRLESKIKNEKWQSRWKIIGLGSDKEQRKVGDGNLHLKDSRVELRREKIGLTEYFNNTSAGLEHGFVLNERQNAGEANLVLTLEIEGDLRAQAVDNGQKLILFDENDEATLTYEKLKVFDANGAELAARMATNEKGNLRFEISDANAVYPITIDPTFVRQAKITASDGAAGDFFGFSVAVSGNTVIVGASDDDIAANTDQGSAYIFVRSGTTWTQQQKLTATDGAAGDFFGANVSISGNSVVVGTSYDDTGSNTDQGSAYIFVRSGTIWTQQQKLTATDGAAGDFFGANVSISSDTAVIGASDDDIGAISNQGSAYVFVRSGTTWSEQQKLTASDGAAGDFFGISVSISGDTTVVGASNDDTGSNTDQGSAYIFVRSGTTWTEQQKLTASDGATEDFFGFSVSVSGNTAIVGAGYDDTGANAEQGSAYIFVRSGTTWTQQQKLTATDGAAGDFFGLGVSIFGDTAVIGASADNIGANTDQGSAYVFVRSGTTWTEQQKLTAEDGAATDFFGFAVALDGNTIIVGASDDDIGASLDQGSATIFAGDTQSTLPSITSINPNSAGAGGASFELTVTGTNFDANSVVRWNGQDRATTFISATQLRAQILASDVQTAGQYPVTVFNSPPGGGLSNAVNFTVTSCTYSLSPTSQNFTAAGGTSSLNITTTSGCVWTATSNVSWITITSGSSGNGNGTIGFSVAANSGPARTGTITAGGQTFTVNQDSGCSYTLSSTSTNIPTAGGNGSVNVITGAGCAWTAVSNVSWITIISGASGTGNGTVTFTVDANTGADRSGTITIAGQTFTVNQGVGCSYSLSPSNTNINAAGGTGNFNVTSGAGCSWTATTTDSWITINSATGSGNGSVTFTVQANTGPARTGTINVNGQIFTVNQAASCSYALSSTSTNIPTGGGNGSVNVISGTGCTWTAMSNVSWITITSGATGTGNGTVLFSVAANTGSARTGTITIAGQTFTVTQAAGTSNLRTAFDFDGDGKADVSVFRPDNGIWYLLNSQTGFIGLQFGLSSDKLVPADYDGDGKTDVAVYRDGTWYLQRSQAGFTGIGFGAPTDIPAPADFDGDGKADIAVYRPSNGTWYMYNLATNQSSGVAFGIAEDKPSPADFDGDGKADIAVFRPSAGTWFLQRSMLGFTGIGFGASTDIPVAADYDGDGKTDVAVFRPSNGVWYLLQSTAGITGVAFGLGTDLPTPADYDGDGKADIAVFRNGTWFLQRSQSGFTGVAFGASTDKPVPNAFVR